MPERMVGLSVSASGEGADAVYGFHVQLDGELIAANRGLTRAQSGAMRELSRRYGELFEQRRAPQVAQGALQALGAELFATWLGGVWERLAPRLAPGDQRLLAIGSDRAEVLNLPWELLALPGGGPGIT